MAQVTVDLIAVPYDSGLRSVRMGRGPEHLLEFGIAEAIEKSNADVSIHVIEPSKEIFGAEIKISFEIQRLVAERVAFAKSRDRFPIVLSGNCNTAVGTVAGLTASSGSPPAVCWLDAHADFNTPETTRSGFLDGMAVAMLAGRCWKGMTSTVRGFAGVPESQIVMSGARHMDELEEQNVGNSGIRTVPIEDAFEAMQSIGPKHIYLHVDLDVFDTSEGSANAFAVEGGISRSDFFKLASQMRNTFTIGALALTAYDPSCDPDNRIARLAVEIARGIATGDGLS